MNHSHPPDKDRVREDALDETIAESFPASDPPSTVPNPESEQEPRGEDDDKPHRGDDRDGART